MRQSQESSAQIPRHNSAVEMTVDPGQPKADLALSDHSLSPIKVREDAASVQTGSIEHMGGGKEKKSKKKDKKSSDRAKAVKKTGAKETELSNPIEPRDNPDDAMQI